MPPIIIACTLGAALSLFLLAYALLPRTSGIDKRLADLDRSVIAREAQGSVFSKLIDEKQRSSLARKLSAAGWYNVTPTHIVIRTVVGGIGGLVVGAALIVFIGDTSPTWLGAGAACVFAGFAAPIVLLDRAVTARQKSVQRALPDLLDMLTTTVEAGVSLNGALNNAIETISGPLADELRSTMADVRLGRSRADALMAMAERVQQPDLLTTVIAIVQAEKLGGNIVAVLEEISIEARESRMMRVEELAAQLPVKMVFPMALFMLPALVVMIFGPVASSLLSKH
jgi:tight adherence protein C